MTAKKKKPVKKRAKTRKPVKRAASKTKVKKASRVAPKKAAARARKTAAPKNIPKPTVIAPPNSVLVGYVEDYFAKIGVVALYVRHPVNVGAHLHVVGYTTNFEQPLESMQIDHQPVIAAKPRAAVGIKVHQRVRRGDHVYLIKPA